MNHKKYRCLFVLPLENIEDEDLMPFLRKDADLMANKEDKGFSFYSMTTANDDDDFIYNRITVIYEYRMYF